MVSRVRWSTHGRERQCNLTVVRLSGSHKPTAMLRCLMHMFMDMLLTCGHESMG